MGKPNWAEFATIIREEALIARGINLNTLAWELDYSDFFGSQSGIIYIGPLFSEDVQKTVHDNLVRLGLTFYDDFFEIDIPLPDWLRLYPFLNK